MEQCDNVKTNYKEIAGRYAVGNEALSITDPVLYNGKKYYMVIYRKRILGITKKEPNGRLLLDKDMKVIKNKNDLRALNELFYYYLVYYSNEIVNLKRTIKTEPDLKKEEEDYDIACRMLDMMADSNIEGAEKVKDILKTFLKMREDTNDALKALDDMVESHKKSGNCFSKEVLDDILPAYRKVIIKNFEKVKYLNRGTDYYDGVKKEVVRQKKQIKKRINKKFQEDLSKLDYILTFIVNLLGYYRNIINYSNDKYMKFLWDRDKQNIDRNFSQLRNEREV